MKPSMKPTSGLTMSMNDREFCRFLSNGLVYNNNSTHFTVSPCCYFSRDYSIDPQGDVGQQIMEYRRHWRQEDFGQTCKTCLDLEQAGKTSYREASFEISSDLDDHVTTLTVAVNKQCNLACASCGPESSSFWFQENKRNGVEQPAHIIELHREDRSGDTTERFLDLFRDLDLSQIEYIKFGGGEPLMSDTHQRILSMIPDPSRVTVQYTSNFSIEPTAQAQELWQRFHLIKWCASIDGVGDQFELLRWPYRWPALEKFIQRQKTQVPHNVMFGVEHTLNPLNIWYFDRFQQWFGQEFSSNRYGDPSDFNIHVCQGPMGLEQTPPALRSAIQGRYGANSAVSILLDNNPYPGSHQRIVQWMDQLDRRRQTQWRRVFREVSDFFD